MTHMPVLLLRLPIKREFDSYCLSKGVELFYFRPLKTGFVENKGQSGPLQLSLNSKANVSCQLNFRLFVSLSVNPIQTLSKALTCCNSLESQY